MSSHRKRYARDKEERIAQVVKISQEVIEDDGYDNLSMNLLHKRTNIPIGTLYKDFPDGKEDILLEIMKSFKDQFEGKYEKFDEESIKNFFFTSLDIGRNRRKFLIAVQLETLKNPDSFIMKARKYASDVNVDTFKQVVEYICGHSITNEKFLDILAVWKAIVRQHIIFRNLHGSDEKFMNMMIKIIRGLGT
ncbi:MAG: TetR/AcrR family transcriptional regulator [Candidatus Lokiarchaeota archaeon]|nr:TetR/AcrR family transcriptional regulator [Candidatus Lokiarchaeota archaeon]